MRKRWFYLVLTLFLAIAQNVYSGSGHDHTENKTTSQNKGNHTNEGVIEISQEGQKASGIKTAIIQPKALPVYISAPGEVIPNMDLTTIVTPRIQAQVVKRLVKTGDHVKQGQSLVLLSSVDMAKAQADLLLAQKEWLRVKGLGKKAVSAKRYQTSEVSYQQAFSRLLAYGMTQSQIVSFIKTSDPNKANGEFSLLAPRNGTIFSADFSEGQMINPGEMLYKIVDETKLWVDARLSNGESEKVKKGNKAIIETSHHKLLAVVLQIHHKLDETTRTRIVRLEVPNPKDQLHPGEFVTCLIQTDKTSPVLSVHKNALMRTPDGDLAVYIEVKPNHFKAQEVKVIKKIGSLRVIKGIEPGTRVVVKGAFFVHSESLKGGFSTHNH